MISNSVTNCFNQNRSFLFDDCFSSSFRCMINSKKIVSVNSDSLHSISYSSSSNTISCILFINWSWNRKQIVSTIEQRLCSKSCSKVHCWMKITFWSSSITKVSYCNSIFIIDSILVPCSWTLRNLSRQRWRNCDNIELLWSIMYRHLSTLSKI